MNKFTCIMALALAAAISTQAADPQKSRERRAERREARRDIDQHIRAINALDNKPAALQAGLRAASQESAVPVPTLQAEHKDHPKIGLAGLFVAHEIATRSKKSADDLIKQRSSGRTWTQIALAHHEDLDVLETKLSRIEEAMRAAK